MLASSSRIVANSTSNSKTCNKRVLRTPDVNLAGLRSLCALADKALQANDLGKVDRLIDTLNKKALVIETKLSKEVQSKWKQALTQTSTTTTKKSGHGDRRSNCRRKRNWRARMAGATSVEVAYTQPHHARHINSGGGWRVAGGEQRRGAECGARWKGGSMPGMTWRGLTSLGLDRRCCGGRPETSAACRASLRSSR